MLYCFRCSIVCEKAVFMCGYPYNAVVCLDEVIPCGPEYLFSLHLQFYLSFVAAFPVYIYKVAGFVEDDGVAFCIAFDFCTDDVIWFGSMCQGARCRTVQIRTAGGEDQQSG